ncbi:DUF3833 domain-containing protein [Pseudoalteromonas sp. MMG010]|uniref:DUF3833 domain-containing protein n=1 Tax=Pseudoalteromonas sp. MMG010 TaxID=2822685 RepID=UPI001B39E4A5|nr:DUF3833 domain-containing protein [Pseudoalteromonas sp. MMG010]MBQ4833419.1 DUF3833 domain-containing protein [Pseudoalteromonas sp. MMG010]
MTKIVKLCLLIIFTSILSSCSSADVSAYKETTPDFNFKRFFSGKLKAYGVVQDYSGDLVRKLVVDMDASWQGNKGTIKEDFIYDDGETQQRTWYITINDDNTITGTADDVIGTARGQSSGGVFHWQYDVELAYDDSMVEVHFDDWMYLISDDRLINRTSINKLGLQVAELTLSIEKVK